MSQFNIGRNSDKANLIELDEDDAQKDHNKPGHRIAIGCAAGVFLLAVPAIAVIQYLRNSSPPQPQPQPESPLKPEDAQIAPVIDTSVPPGGATGGKPPGGKVTPPPAPVTPKPSPKPPQKNPDSVDQYMDDLLNPK